MRDFPLVLELGKVVGGEMSKENYDLWYFGQQERQEPCQCGVTNKQHCDSFTYGPISKCVKRAGFDKDEDEE